MTRAPLFACIEAGGTKFVLGVARGRDTILRTTRIPTTTPAETLTDVRAFFTEAQGEWGAFDALGVAAFGPIDLNRLSGSWGQIVDTPKAGWSGTNLVGALTASLDCPVELDTDVNAAILAESLWGAAVGCDIAVYVTIGTGIGGGALITGVPVHGSRHPEMGHMLPRRHPDDLAFAGSCPFHGDCLEGLASGPAIIARWGASLSTLDPDHPAHEIIAYYLAQLIVAQQAVLSPQRIVVGGGVLGTFGLLDRVRRQAAKLAKGYFGTADYSSLITAPALGDSAGLLGALALAQRASR